MTQQRAACKRVSEEFEAIVKGVKGMSRLSNVARLHLQQCPECRRKEMAALRTITDVTDPVTPDLTKRDPKLARQLAHRIVRAAHLFASLRTPPPPLVRHELYLLHDAITLVLAAGASNVLPILPSVLPEVARSLAEYFAAREK